MTDVRFLLADPSSAPAPDTRVELELRLDGARGGWWTLSGLVVRVTAGREIVVALDALPTDFEDGIQAELLAELEGEAMSHVILVDPLAWRRGRMAASLRASGQRVTEAATPLEALGHLADSRAHPAVIAIADTIPEAIAEDLRAYVSREHADLRVLRMP